jgi:hypothetical protein
VQRTKQYRFKINPYTPETIPMARLVEYMREIVALFGETDNVHFVKLEKGSCVAVENVAIEAVPKVEERITKAKRSDGPTEPIQAIKNINRMLREDNGSGVLARGRTTTILKFPGQEEKPLSYGLVSAEGSLDGFVNRVGGDTDPCPIHLKTADGSNVYLCDADREIAKQLGRYMFDYEVRVQGTGRWSRNDDGDWALERFRIRSFEVLKDLPLSAAVAELRSVPNSDWPKMADPWAELDRIRNGPLLEKNGHK